MGTASCLPRRTAARMSVDRTPPSNAKVKNEWSYTSTLVMWFHATMRDNSASVSNINILLLIESLPC